MHLQNKTETGPIKMTSQVCYASNLQKNADAIPMCASAAAHTHATIEQIAPCQSCDAVSDAKKPDNIIDIKHIYTKKKKKDALQCLWQRFLSRGNISIFFTEMANRLQD